MCRLQRWLYWKLDWFSATQAFLNRFPWLFIRGDHELCSIVAPGFYYLLDFASDTTGVPEPQRECPAQVNQSDLVVLTPQNFQEFVEVLPPVLYQVICMWALCTLISVVTVVAITTIMHCVKL